MGVRSAEAFKEPHPLLVADPEALRGHDSDDSRCLSFGPPGPGVCGTAHVATPNRGSSQTCSSHQTATAISVNALSLSAPFSASIQQSPHTVTGTLPNGVGERCRRGLATETHGVPQTDHQRRTAATGLAVPRNGITRRRIELSVQVP